MDYWYFTITIYSELDGIEYTERGVLIADDQVEATQKLERFYEGDIIRKLDLQWMSDEGVCLLPSEAEPVIPNITTPFFNDYDWPTELHCNSNSDSNKIYTVNYENISQFKETTGNPQASGFKLEKNKLNFF